MRACWERRSQKRVLFEHVEKDGGTDFREEEVCEGDIFSIDKVAEEAEGLFLDLGFGVVAELHDVLWRVRGGRRVCELGRGQRWRA